MWLEEKLWVPIEAFRQTPNIEHLTAEIMIQTCRETVHQIILLSKIKKQFQCCLSSSLLSIIEGLHITYPSISNTGIFL